MISTDVSNTDKSDQPVIIDVEECLILHFSRDYLLNSLLFKKICEVNLRDF